MRKFWVDQTHLPDASEAIDVNKLCAERWDQRASLED